MNEESGLYKWRIIEREIADNLSRIAMPSLAASRVMSTRILRRIERWKTRRHVVTRYFWQGIDFELDACDSIRDLERVTCSMSILYNNILIVSRWSDELINEDDDEDCEEGLIVRIWRADIPVLVSYKKFNRIISELDCNHESSKLIIVGNWHKCTCGLMLEG